MVPRRAWPDSHWDAVRPLGVRGQVLWERLRATGQAETPVAGEDRVPVYHGLHRSRVDGP
jgi:hypothetical protein